MVMAEQKSQEVLHGKVKFRKQGDMKNRWDENGEVLARESKI